MLVYHASGVEAIGLAGNIISAAMVLYLFASTIVNANIIGRYGALFITLGVALTATIATNIAQLDPVDLLKYISLYVVYFAARAFGQQNFPSRTMMAGLIVIPLLLAPFGSLIYMSSPSLDNQSFSFFETYNAAVIYFTGLLFYLYPLLGRFAAPLQLAVAIAFGKIGAMVASGLAFTAWTVRLSLRSTLIVILGVSIAGFALTSGAFDRAIQVISTLSLDLITIGPSRIASMSYAQISQIAGSSDVSGYFRIKHWYEIWTLYSSDSIAHVLFGYGPGESKNITMLRLVPHNDYLRILVEFGILNLLCFLSLLFIALRNLADNNLRALFTVYIVFSFSDNLLDNFSSVVLFFGSAGLYVNTLRSSSVPNSDSARPIRELSTRS
jgi:hypothetical protein